MKKLIIILLFGLSLYACDDPEVSTWPKGHIPYMLYGFTSVETIKIIECMLTIEFMTKGKVKFIFVLMGDKHIPKDARVLHIFKIDGNNSSFTFMPGGNQNYRHYLVLRSNSKRYIYHELFHSLGFPHEHQRPDRDRYITINYNNLDPGQLLQFIYYVPSDYAYDYTKYNYDYQSITHYKKDDAGYDSISAPNGIILGGDEPSVWDWIKLNDLYSD